MKRSLEQQFTVWSQRFTKLSKAKQQRLAISTTACLTALTWLIIVQKTTGLSGSQIGTISIPRISYSNNDTMKQEQLIPLGKMKGEVNGQFDSFYVAIDKNARIFINRDIDHGPSAYLPSKKWEEITRTKLAEYERELTYRPFNQKSKSLKR